MGWKSLLFFIFIFLFCLIFFSFKLLDVPRGITIDEAAFGYNASLISETLRDENGRFLPVFVLSLDGRDWRQPITQYFQVLTFKIFGRSLFNLKFTSVIIAAASSSLIFLLGQQLFGRKFGLAALLIFITTPVIMIHSHLALDNIMPVPFIILWLLGLWNYQKSKSLKFLILSGVSLGIGFYAHKSMRSAVSVWAVLSLVYLWLTQIKSWKIDFKKYRPLIIFLISIAPFYLISPILNYKYAGAVYGTGNIGFSSFYDFFYFYISNFDPSFLFIKGDTILHHSTGTHGMFLLASLPLFIYGAYKSFRDGNIFFRFLVICFFAAPLLLGLVGSIHRASRIIFLVPLFSLISAFGFWKLLEVNGKIFKWILISFCLIFLINLFDFLNYYWFKYAQDSYHIFYLTESINAYKKLSEVAQSSNRKPLIASSLLQTQGDSGSVEDFTRSLYFIKPQLFSDSNELSEAVVVLTNENIDGLTEIEAGVDGYRLYFKD